MPEQKSIKAVHLDNPLTDVNISAGGLSINGTRVDATAAELNVLYLSGLSAVQMTGIAANTYVSAVFDTTATGAEAFAGTKVLVPALAGKIFVPVTAFIAAYGGTVATATLVRIVDADANVIMSQIAAELTAGTWTNEGTTSAVCTAMRKATAANKNIFLDCTTGAFTGATSVRGIVQGFYALA